MRGSFGSHQDFRVVGAMRESSQVTFVRVNFRASEQLVRPIAHR